MDSPLVTLEDVDVRLWGRDLLREIRFTLREGEGWAVLGGNGAGKSTLLRLLRGEIWPSPVGRGRRTFHLDGAATESPIGVRERIALVSAEGQDHYARRDQAVPVEDVVRSGFSDGTWPGGRLDRDGERAVDEALDALGLTALRHRTMLEVSTGEARRALLARALAPRPRALLLDEFVNGLDAVSRERVLATVSSRARAGTATVLATHRPEEIVPEARHALVLEGGRIVRQGALPEVLDWWRATRGVPVCPPLPAPQRNSPHDPLFQVQGDVLVEGRRVLRGLDWTLRRGESWAVRGPNGSGKSTFLRLLLGEEHLAPGGRVERLDLGPDADVRDVKARVGLVSQDLQARHRTDATGLEVVLSGFPGSIGLGVETTEGERRAAREWMAAVGALHLEHRSIHAISYGELRRLLFARALVIDPEVLLLDEPFSGLDPRAREGLRELVEGICRSGRAVVLVTHHDDEVVPSISSELRLRDGNVERCGALEPSARR